jgi:hypothetical protein
MEFVYDRYVIIAADLTVAFAGRGWNARTRQWETISGGDLLKSEDQPGDRLRHLRITGYNATTLSVKQGMCGGLYVVSDPVATGFTVRLPCTGMQGGNSTIKWVGDYPLGSGVLWRVNLGGVIAGDVIECVCGFERQHGKR